MTTFTWGELCAAEPEFAARVEARFDSHTHKLLGTVRADGSPRISGVEVQFADGHLWFGSMDESRKTADLRRDPRCVFHSAPDDATMPGGDAKISGLATPDDPGRIPELWGFEPTDEPVDGMLFRIELRDVTLTRVEDPELVIETYDAERGLREIRRH